ncbi:cytochrome d ubiquinol oxidase subunit II [Amycolatopsis rhizosphaerae]|uniref:Cytochrome d ubiquinol oxidase subunit II n=1 Tax=Amycolatopsis rhizosphaerae TaxID=2053003 RepID=A0A558B6C4_9PSEU|nr:cytochrome d ubiquinol oxidase subunit II [Amycolatopsis rhizosphaerae]TVT32065.1 cytochrome d ubiquinol oxidase subunit II [Amycolatopsis rhizosphaerae]
MAGTPAGELARKLGVRTGRIVLPCGLLLIFVGAVLFVYPPHSGLLAFLFAVLGVAGFALGTARLAAAPWWALGAAVALGFLLFAVLTVPGRGLVLRVFGHSETCRVASRREVDTTSRYPRYGFVHTVDCPGAGTLVIRTDSADRQPLGPVEVLDDPGGPLQPDFAERHNVVVDSLLVAAAIALTSAAVCVAWLRSANQGRRARRPRVPEVPEG